MANKERVQLFVAALRSGEYEQGRDTLVKDDDGFKYCCLGVACDVARKNGLFVDFGMDEDGDYRFDGITEALPSSVYEWYGLDDADPVIGQGEDGDGINAVQANDDLYWDFNKIADAFEETYINEGTYRG